MRLRSNFLAGLASSAWSALLALAVVPLYVKYLGIESYGLVGFFMTMQAILMLLDLGLAPTINREIARYSTSDDTGEAQSLLHTFAIFYYSVAVAIALAVVLLAPVISSQWLSATNISQSRLSHAVLLMGIVVACRWPIGLYLGVLMGMQRMVLSSAITALMVTIGNIGAVLVLAVISSSVEAFFVWQALVALLQVAVMRHAAWSALGARKAVMFDFGHVRRVWRFSLGMGGVAISGTILIQLDKLLLSGMLSLDEFGRYTLAAVAAGGLYVLLTPLFNAIYPRLSSLVASGQKEGLVSLYMSTTRLFLTLLLPVAFTSAVFAKELLYLWTRNLDLATGAAPIFALFIVGTALNGIMHFPYALQLAYGSTRLPLTINAILLAVMVPMTVALATSYGAIGGAAAWALLNAIYLVVGTVLTHRRLLCGLGKQWFFREVGTPMVTALIMAVVCKELLQGRGFPLFIQLLGASMLTLLPLAITLARSTAIRNLSNTIVQLRSQGSGPFINPGKES